MVYNMTYGKEHDAGFRSMTCALQYYHLTSCNVLPLTDTRALRSTKHSKQKNLR